MVECILKLVKNHAHFCFEFHHNLMFVCAVIAWSLELVMTPILDTFGVAASGLLLENKATNSRLDWSRGSLLELELYYELSWIHDTGSLGPASVLWWIILYLSWLHCSQPLLWLNRTAVSGLVSPVQFFSTQLGSNYSPINPISEQTYFCSTAQLFKSNIPMKQNLG